MTMDINFLNLMPVAVIVIIYGVTWAARAYTLQPDGSSPKWLILIPLALGFLLGIMEYYMSADSAILASGPFAKHLMTALFRGFTYGGAAVMLWELRKKYFPLPGEKS